ncbi:hypothetical protein [Anaerovorax odorimutans]|uniref:hypothetical protein n=1 Tax=Anaerovorax odorimutans TaxID=109327 RepID=UPI0004026A17|nr:hypothetical protein [Anaerovorax odorimutans]
MESIYYTVKQIRGEYAILFSDDGIENTVAMALLPMEIAEGKRLLWENFVYKIIEGQ